MRFATWEVLGRLTLRTSLTSSNPQPCPAQARPVVPPFDSRSRPRCSSSASRACSSMLPLSLEAQPSTPSPTFTPASRSSRTGQMPAGGRGG